MRSLGCLVVLLSLAAMSGCSSSQVYSRSPGILEGQEVTVRTRLHEGVLRTQAQAGRYAVDRVALVLADGSTVEPSFSAATSQAERGGSGFRLGTGIGTGVGSGVGVGVGTSVPIGGRRTTVLSVGREARWESPPLDKQPFTLRITLATEPPAVVHVPLGRVSGTQEANSTNGRVETWKLPDGTTRRYLVTPAAADAPPMYTPVE